ncbi:MAG: hypothetical protein IBX41_09295 [Methanophagales archaeon]|nr:hypothetical protein [Methanophagales archaeon]
MSVQKSLTTEQFRRIIREEVQRIIDKEILKLRLSLLPLVSEKEQSEIEKMFGKKPKKKDIVYVKEIEI